MKTCNKLLHMWTLTWMKTVDVSLLFLHFTLLHTVTVAHWRREVHTEGKLKESKVFTCWILIVLSARLRARGCRWYKMWTFLRMRPGTWKSTGGQHVREYTTPALRLKCGLKAVMEKGRSALWQLPAEMLYTHATVKVHYLFHTALSTHSKAVLQCYENTSRGEFDLCAFQCDFECPPPFLSSSVEHNFSLFLSHSSWVTSQWPATLAHSDSEGWDTLRTSSLRRKSRNV